MLIFLFSGSENESLSRYEIDIANDFCWNGINRHEKRKWKKRSPEFESKLNSNDGMNKQNEK